MADPGTPPRVPHEALGCFALYAVFGLALVGPPCALAQGPVWGVAAAGASLAFWIRWGPSPMPGLVPGLMGLMVIGCDLVVVGIAVLRLVTRVMG